MKTIDTTDSSSAKRRHFSRARVAKTVLSRSQAEQISLLSDELVQVRAILDCYDLHIVLGTERGDTLLVSGRSDPVLAARVGSAVRTALEEHAGRLECDLRAASRGTCQPRPESSGGRGLSYAEAAALIEANSGQIPSEDPPAA
jgi:hypothetical protein